MEPRLNIRCAQMEDATVIHELLSQLGYENSQEQIQSRLKSLLFDCTQKLLLAEVDGVVVGLAALICFPYFHDGERLARLSSLVVEQRSRGQGIGKRLLIAAEQWARIQNCQRLELTTSTKRTDAHRFYERENYAFSARRYVKDISHSAGDNYPII